MNRSWQLVVVGLCLVLGAARMSAGDTPKETQYQIDLRVLEGDPLGSREEGTIQPLSQPCLVTVEKQEAQCISGQVVKINGENVRVGMNAKITPERGEGGTIQLKIFIEYSKVQPPFNENNLIVQSSQARYTRTVKPGEVLRLRLGKSPEGLLWAELTAREFEPGK